MAVEIPTTSPASDEQHALHRQSRQPRRGPAAADRQGAFIDNLVMPGMLHCAIFEARTRTRASAASTRATPSACPA
jgi:hypothetical protein